MPEGSILSDDFLRELINVGEVDILIGVPTYNDARTVGQVVQAIRAGLLKYFPRQRAVIINADGGSKDGSQDLVRAASISDISHSSNLNALRTLHCISTQYSGGSSSGNSLHLIFSAAELLRPNICSVVASDSTSIEPDWMEHLLRPIARDNVDLVTPLYTRHKFDGLLVRNLAYPMTRAIYGMQVREPFPSDFAFSGKLGSHFLSQDLWSQDSVKSGAEMGLTISAIAGGFRVAESFLGKKSRMDHAPADLVAAIRQTAGVLFWSMDGNFSTWSKVADSQPLSTIGAAPELTLEPLRVNRKRLREMFCVGVTELEPLLRSIVSPATMDELKRCSGAPEAEFRYPDELWVRTVYEFAASYHESVISRDHIIQALAPLYRGKAYTFLSQNRDASGEEVEKNVEALCMTFEQHKPYLLELWNGRK